MSVYFTKQPHITDHSDQTIGPGPGEQAGYTPHARTGDTLEITAEAIDTEGGTLTYKWKIGNTTIDFANSAVLTLDNMTSAMFSKNITCLGPRIVGQSHTLLQLVFCRSMEDLSMLYKER